jgi:hypothetical protein
MERQGWVDVLGFPIRRGLVASSAERSLSDAIPGRPRPILLLEIGEGAALRHEYTRAAEALAGMGHDVESVLVPGSEAWWLVADEWEAEEGRQMTQQLIDLTEGFLERRFVAGAMR